MSEDPKYVITEGEDGYMPDVQVECADFEDLINGLKDMEDYWNIWDFLPVEIEEVTPLGVLGTDVIDDMIPFVYKRSKDLELDIRRSIQVFFSEEYEKKRKCLDE
jgi:hypothetical protein